MNGYQKLNHGLPSASWVRSSLQIAVSWVGDSDMNSAILSLSSPVIGAENISKTICPARPLRHPLGFLLPLSGTLLPLATYSLFWFHLRLLFTLVLSAWTETKCHRKWKVKAESVAPFQKERWNKGALWSSRVTFLSAVIPCLDNCCPASQNTVR